MFTRKNNLYNHLKFQCGQSPRFCCPYCPYRTRHSSNVRSHIRRMHPDQRVYVLDICDDQRSNEFHWIFERETRGRLAPKLSSSVSFFFFPFPLLLFFAEEGNGWHAMPYITNIDCIKITIISNGNKFLYFSRAFEVAQEFLLCTIVRPLNFMYRQCTYTACGAICAGLRACLF